MKGSKIADNTSLEQLINRQMNLWDVRRRISRAGGEEARSQMLHLQEGPWITLSRQVGSGGSELARMLAERLGWQVFDREIVTAIARDDPAREKLLSRLDEHAVGALQDFLSNVLVREAMSRNKYAHEVARIVWTVARHGRAILVGRGANWLLDPRYGLRVRAVAPLSDRARRISAERTIDPILAGQEVLREDGELAAFIRQTYHREIDDPMGYDLIVNLGTLEMGAAADAVITALKSKLGAHP
jgi:cytidylate kinase